MSIESMPVQSVESSKKVNLLGEKRRESIERTLLDLEKTAGMIKFLLAQVDHAEEKGGKLPEGLYGLELEKMRYPGGVAGPGSDLERGLSDLANLFHAAQEQMNAQFPETRGSDFIKKFRENR